MEEIPPESIFNWDQTDIPQIPVFPWTMEQTCATRVEISGITKSQQFLWYTYRSFFAVTDTLQRQNGTLSSQVYISM